MPPAPRFFLPATHVIIGKQEAIAMRMQNLHRHLLEKADVDWIAQHVTGEKPCSRITRKTKESEGERARREREREKRRRRFNIHRRFQRRFEWWLEELTVHFEGEATARAGFCAAQTEGADATAATVVAMARFDSRCDDQYFNISLILYLACCM